MSFIIGLTGSIGMGKSTTAKMFADQGIPVWDADVAVADVYGKNASAVEPIKALDKSLIQGEAVSKSALKSAIRSDPEFLKKLELIVHPLVRMHRQNFLEQTDAPIVLLDIPLLFETGMDAHVDLVVCVSVDAKTQKQRVLERGTMTEADFNIILEKQMPNEEKVAKADFVVPTDTIKSAQMAVDAILVDVRKRVSNA
jgi:dephospho-CoA kinase